MASFCVILKTNKWKHNLHGGSTKNQADPQVSHQTEIHFLCILFSISLAKFLSWVDLITVHSQLGLQTIFWRALQTCEQAELRQRELNPVDLLERIWRSHFSTMTDTK